MIDKCKKCNGNVDFLMSDIYFINNTKPQQVGIEGICIDCSTHYFIKFKAFECEITNFKDFTGEEEKEVIQI